MEPNPGEHGGRRVEDIEKIQKEVTIQQRGL